MLALANFIPLVILDERNVVKHGRGWTFQVAFQMRDSHIGEMLTIRLLVLDILALVVDDPIIARGMNVDSVDSVAANVDAESHHAPGGFTQSPDKVWAAAEVARYLLYDCLCSTSGYGKVVTSYSSS